MFTHEVREYPTDISFFDYMAEATAIEECGLSILDIKVTGRYKSHCFSVTPDVMTFDELKEKVINFVNTKKYLMSIYMDDDHTYYIEVIA